MRIHDLRHTSASGGPAVGEGLLMIGKLLGHTLVQTSARYAHLTADPVKYAADKITAGLAALPPEDRRPMDPWERSFPTVSSQRFPTASGENNSPGPDIKRLG